MTETMRALSDEAQKLPPIERLALVEELLESLDQTDPSIDEAWAREAEDRLAAYRRGEIGAIPLAEVLARYQSR